MDMFQRSTKNYTTTGVVANYSRGVKYPATFVTNTPINELLETSLKDA